MESRRKVENVKSDEEKTKKDKISTQSRLVLEAYEMSSVKVEDPGLRRYINLDTRLFAKTYGRAKQRFGKAKVHLLERLANILGVPGHRGKKHKIITKHATGKYNKNMKILMQALEIVGKKTGQNPVQVLVKAIENAAPHDEITTIEYGGARYPQAVDTSPYRRLSLALRHIVHGGYDKAFNKKTNIAEGLAQEIILAYQNSPESFAIQKKTESERQADAAR